VVKRGCGSARVGVLRAASTAVIVALNTRLPRSCGFGGWGDFSFYAKLRFVGFAPNSRCQAHS
jgi:hypothetical protein